MSRIPPLRHRDWPPQMRDALWAMSPPQPRYALTDDGRPKGANILGAFAHHPALARAFFTLNGHLLLATTLSERHRELIIMRIAVRKKSSYEWAQHVFMSRDAGLTDLEIGGIAWGPTAPLWGELDAAVLCAVDELDGDGRIADATWELLAKHLDVPQILDLIFTAGSYAMLAWMVESMGIELDDDLRDGIAGLMGRSSLAQPSRSTPPSAGATNGGGRACRWSVAAGRRDRCGRGCPGDSRRP
jgi:alkylhydroperoxidase family enzyme